MTDDALRQSLDNANTLRQRAEVEAEVQTRRADALEERVEDMEKPQWVAPSPKCATCGKPFTAGDAVRATFDGVVRNVAGHSTFAMLMVETDPKSEKFHHAACLAKETKPQEAAKK